MDNKEHTAAVLNAETGQFTDTTCRNSEVSHTLASSSSINRNSQVSRLGQHFIFGFLRGH